MSRITVDPSRRALTFAAVLATSALSATVGYAQRPTRGASTGPTVQAASVRQVELVPGGDPVVITLRGERLDGLTDALVAARGRPVPDTKAELSPARSRTTRDVELLAGPRARPGTWELRLSYRDARRRTTSIVAPVRVVVQPPKTRDPPPEEASPEGPPPFEPVSLTTDPLRFTGRRFVPVALTTDPLRFTGRRFVPVHVQTETLRFTGRREENR